MLMEPKLYVKGDGAPEFEVSDEIQGLQFLGDTDNPVPVNTYTTNSGVDGQVPLMTTYDKSTVSANFLLEFGDYYDFKLAEHDLYRLFNGRGLLRLRTDAEPAKVRLVKPSVFTLAPSEPGSHFSQFSIPFENPSGYKYSLARSDNLYDYDSELWQVGMNLPNGEDLQYRFTTMNFQVYNASDIPIDPYWQCHDLKLICHFTGSKMQLTNKTNGSVWTYSVPAKMSDTIILDGIACTLNGSPAGMNTDCRNLVLEPGWNTISVTGATDVDITFSFPFIYLG